MEPVSDPANLGTGVLGTRLGPGVVGRRVVVRRLLRDETGPTGGPAFTDVLGVCVRWSDGVVVVEREDGSRVQIATADIVSGKPVPPRPPVRHRVGVRDAEGHAAPLWPRVERRPLGDWELRLDPAPVGRPRKRANSCLAIGDPGMPLEEAGRLVTDFYRERDRPTLVQVEADSDVDLALQAAGWRPVAGDADLLLGSLSRARRLLGGLDKLDHRREETEHEWRIELVDDDPRAESRCLMGETLIGAAEAAYDGDWLGVHTLQVEEGRRRRGIGRALVAELLEFGAEHGCLTLWLHLEVDNAPARAMYESLGLAVHHTCRYLEAP